MKISVFRGITLSVLFLTVGVAATSQPMQEHPTNPQIYVSCEVTSIRLLAFWTQGDIRDITDTLCEKLLRNIRRYDTLFPWSFSTSDHDVSQYTITFTIESHHSEDTNILAIELGPRESEAKKIAEPWHNLDEETEYEDPLPEEASDKLFSAFSTIFQREHANILKILQADLTEVARNLQPNVSANSDLLDEIDNMVRRDVAQLSAIARGPNAANADINRPLVLDSDVSWAGNQSTSNSNPTLDSECHEGSMQRALEVMKTNKNLDHEHAMDMIEGHIRQRQAFEKTGITYSDYLAHVAECKNLCNVVVTELIGCHIRAVSSLSPMIILFDLDSIRIDDLGEETILSMAKLLAERPDKRVLLIGRASRIGDIGHNRRLSLDRARMIGLRLTDEGIASSRIRTLQFGYEPPQINKAIADSYKIRDLYEREGHHRLNQSVVIVAY